jgi:hypothetical protein
VFLRLLIIIDQHFHNYVHFIGVTRDGRKRKSKYMKALTDQLIIVRQNEIKHLESELENTEPESESDILEIIFGCEDDQREQVVKTLLVDIVNKLLDQERNTIKKFRLGKISINTKMLFN